MTEPRPAVTISSAPGQCVSLNNVPNKTISTVMHETKGKESAHINWFGVRKTLI